jgi:hypothetical protein
MATRKLPYLPRYLILSRNANVKNFHHADVAYIVDLIVAMATMYCIICSDPK